MSFRLENIKQSIIAKTKNARSPIDRCADKEIIELALSIKYYYIFDIFWYL